MSSVSSPNVDALTRQMEDILRETDALMEALARARRLRLLLALVVLVFVVVFCTAFYRLGADFISDENQKKVLDIAQKRLNENSPRYMKEVQTLVNNVSPPLTSAFTDEAQKELPNFFKAMENQTDPLINKLQDELTNKLVNLHHSVENKQGEMLLKEFPELKDEQTKSRMLYHMQTAIDKLLKKYYVEEMQKEMQELLDNWHEFPMAKKPLKDEPSLEDEFIATLLRILSHRLAHVEGTPATATK